MQFVVGKGGVGRTTVAAATAVALARRGSRVLVVSLDQAHSLATVFAGAPACRGDADAVAAVTDRIDLLELDTLTLLERRLTTLAALVPRGGDHDHESPLTLPDAQELTGLPGAQELLALGEVTRLVDSGEWDAVLVDCPATADALRLLAVPEMFADYLERIWPMHRRALVGPAAAQWQLVAALLVDRLVAATVPIRQLLGDHTRAGVRLVVGTGAVALAEARLTVTGLALLGLRLDEVLANGLVPQYDVDGELGAGPEHPALRRARRRRAAQDAGLAALRADLGAVPLRTADEHAVEPVGLAELEVLAAALFPAQAAPLPDRGSAPSREHTVALESGSGLESLYAMRVPLPLADPTGLTLGRVEDDLVVGAAGLRRRIRLASVLRRCTTVGADFEGDDLVVRFRPDPQVWPQ
ncbi:ArsA family ATPase [Rhodococcus kronopolitis]|uniref:ArsA family ATPase n=1 Tax=Rhodococcus kronopolitis TaxID=1460226 RepID=A0ABV9FNP7_9NOCA